MAWPSNRVNVDLLLAAKFGNLAVQMIKSEAPHPSMEAEFFAPKSFGTSAWSYAAKAVCTVAWKTRS